MRAHHSFCCSCAAAHVASTPSAFASEVHVMISGGFTAAYKELVPQFEKATGNTVVTAYGPSMGETPQAIPMRLARGEPADVLIMVGYALGDLVSKGKVVADSRVDLADLADRRGGEGGRAEAGPVLGGYAEGGAAEDQDRGLFGQRQRCVCQQARCSRSSALPTP